MKIFAFTDVHGNTKALKKIEATVKKQKPDLLVCCGDISIFDHYAERTLKKLASLHKPLFLIHGNHDSETKIEKLCKQYKNVSFIHKKIKMFGNLLFVGYGGGGFMRIDKEFEKFARKIEHKIKTENIILLTHGPPYKTRLDYIYGEHVGCVSFKKFIISHPKTILALSGHIHETAGAQDKIKKT